MVNGCGRLRFESYRTQFEAAPYSETSTRKYVEADAKRSILPLALTIHSPFGLKKRSIFPASDTRNVGKVVGRKWNFCIISSFICIS